jgi:hypothetical protein
MQGIRSKSLFTNSTPIVFFSKKIKADPKGSIEEEQG